MGTMVINENRIKMICCSVCKSQNIVGFMEIDKLPLLLFPVDESVKDDIIAKTIKAFRCTECNHIFTAPLDTAEVELIYGKYYRYYPFENLETMNSAYRLPFEKVFDRVFAKHCVHTKGETLLEIGCSSGEQLKYFGNYGLSCQGIDPSPLNVDESGRIISGLYETYEFARQYDIIVSRFNLEHLNDIHIFYEKVWSDLSDNGILFVQVPNIPVFVANFIPLFLAHEHIQYFNPYSLSLASKKHGFTVIDIEYTDSQSILITLQKSLEKGPEENGKIEIQKLSPTFYSDYLQKRTGIAEDFKTLLNERREICFYGAGLALCWILYDLCYADNGKNRIVIDDNPLLHGRFLPGTSYRISAFDAAILRYSTVLLTLSPTYHTRVVQKLFDAGYQGEIFSLDNQGLHKVALK